MKRCKLFGDQCFRRNMVYTNGDFRMSDFYQRGSGCYFIPMSEKLIYLNRLVPVLENFQLRDAGIYYNRSLQVHTATRELRCCLTAFED